MSDIPSIPDFSDDLQSLQATVRVLRHAVEIISGRRQGLSLGAPQMFVQDNEPVTPQVAFIKKGDIWVSLDPKALFVWSGKIWEQIV